MISGEPGKPTEITLMMDSTQNLVDRLWRRDYTLWNPSPHEISNRLGWLTLPEEMVGRVSDLQLFAKKAVDDGFTHAVLCGMGGSSLAAEVLRNTIGVSAGSLGLLICDSTHPRAIASMEELIDWDTTLFIIASKSGETIETLSHFHYLHSRTVRRDQFVAITDGGSMLERLAQAEKFREVFLNPSDVGGRYSALSLFGLVPFALMGGDIEALLAGGRQMADKCRVDSLDDNPGASLGQILANAALSGRDKVTFVLPEEIAGLGHWVEQLLAESTGKLGKGIVPVVGEEIGPPSVYGDDRLFVAYGESEALDALREAGHPVVVLDYGAGAGGLGGEFFRWEFAVAVAGHLMAVNPFDQPDVASAKEATKTVLEKGELDQREAVGDDLDSVLATIGPGDYVAIQAFLPSAEETGALHKARMRIRDKYQVATTLGFGPRFLHSTGQLHKGGPNTGVMIQVVDPERKFDIEIPGSPYTFGDLLDAQALGDLQALRAKGRRAARVTSLD